MDMIWERVVPGKYGTPALMFSLKDAEVKVTDITAHMTQEQTTKENHK